MEGSPYSPWPTFRHMRNSQTYSSLAVCVDLVPSRPGSLSVRLSHWFPVCTPVSLVPCLYALSHWFPVCTPVSLVPCLYACLTGSLSVRLSLWFPVCTPVSLVPCLYACLTGSLSVRLSHWFPVCTPVSLVPCLYACLTGSPSPFCTLIWQMTVIY